MIKKYRQVVLFSPILVSGGPEAIHQLAHLTSFAGPRASIAYIGGGSRVRITDGVLDCETQPDNPCLLAYERYHPVVARNVALTEDTLVVLPEISTGDVHLFGKADVAIFWLSVDNAFFPRSALHNPEYRKSFFANRRVIHLSPAAYTREFLKQQGVPEIFDVGDFTDETFTRQVPRGPNAGRAIAYNPKKGGEAAAAFFAANPDFEPCALQGMSKAEVYDNLGRCRIYIEFGHSPGKDRMPREALTAGCIILAHRKGSAAFFEDTPIAESFKFDMADVGSGQLAATVRAILAESEASWRDQDHYRACVYSERWLMSLQVKRLFGSIGFTAAV